MMRGTATPACEFIFAVVSFDGFEAYDSQAPGPSPDSPRSEIGGPPARAEQHSSRYALAPVVRPVGAPAYKGASRVPLPARDFHVSFAPQKRHNARMLRAGRYPQHA